VQGTRSVRCLNLWRSCGEQDLCGVRGTVGGSGVWSGYTQSFGTPGDRGPSVRVRADLAASRLGRPRGCPRRLACASRSVRRSARECAVHAAPGGRKHVPSAHDPQHSFPLSGGRQGVAGPGAPAGYAVAFHPPRPHERHHADWNDRADAGLCPLPDPDLPFQPVDLLPDPAHSGESRSGASEGSRPDRQESLRRRRGAGCRYRLRRHLGDGRLQGDADF